MVNKKRHTMAVLVWKKYRGAIPKNFVIHHIDGNVKNDKLSNLMCISRMLHGLIHQSKIKKIRGVIYKKCSTCFEYKVMTKNFYSRGKGYREKCKPCAIFISRHNTIKRMGINPL